MAIITAAQVKEYLGVSGSGDDTLIGSLIGYAEAAALRFTNRDAFASAVIAAEKHDGDGTSSLFTRATPISTMTSVTTIDDAGTETVRDSTDYRHNPNTGEIRLLGSSTARWGGGSVYSPVAGPSEYRYASPSWPYGFQNVSIAYTGGWADGSEPADLISALIETTAIMYRESKRDGTLASESLGDYSYTIKADDDRYKRVRMLLGPFVRWTL